MFRLKEEEDAEVGRCTCRYVRLQSNGMFIKLESCLVCNNDPRPQRVHLTFERGSR